MKFLDLSEGRFYRIKCSDWSVIIQANNENEACVDALVEMLERRGKDLKLSSVMISEELQADVMSQNYEETVSYHSVSRMLADAGQHELSSNMREIFGS